MGIEGSILNCGSCLWTSRDGPSTWPVREKLNDPRVTKFDLDGMLTKWRDAKAWLVHDEDARAAGLPGGL